MTSWRSVVGPEEAGLPGAQLDSDEPAGIPNSNAAWTVPRSETEFDYAGPYNEITRCRQELAASFPGSLWRESTKPKYQMEAVVDIPAELTWNGVTNNCSSPYRVNVYYPVGASGRSPLVSFAHGFGNGGSVLDERNRERIFTPLVQEGFFVIAYQHNGYCDTPNNQMGAIEWLKTSSYASMIDFSNVGVAGFSLGGVASWKSTSQGNPDIKAAVSISAYCGIFGNSCPVPELPTLMLTGSADRTSPVSKQRQRFNQMSGPGMLVETPMPHSFNTFWSVEAMLPLMKSMFHCYLRDDQEACSQLNERGPLEDTCFGTTSWRSVVGPEEAGLPSAELDSDEPAGIPNSNAAWTVPRSETEFDFAGPYNEITRCRQELAASFPGSLWRESTKPKYQMEAVVDIPAELTWNGVTNNCSSPYRVNVYYPVGASGRSPLVSFAHGFGNGGSVLDERNRERIFQPLVEEGFFVIAYQHNGYCDTPNNQMGAIEWLKTSEYASMIDFSNVGVTGFSL